MDLAASAKIGSGHDMRNAAAMPSSDGGGSDADWLRQIVLQHCRGVDGDVVVNGPVTASRSSQIFHATGSAFRVPVAIKLFLTQPAGEAAREYYQALSDLRRLVQPDHEVGTVKPICLIEDHGIVVTEWLAGLTVARAVTSRRPAEAAQAIARAGVWLGRLQDATAIERKPFDAYDRLRRLQRSMDARPRAARGNTAQRAAQLLHRMAGRVGAGELIWCRTHGDLKPRNLMLCDGRVYGIDVGGHDQVPCVHDAAHFLNHLHLLFLAPKTLHRLRQVPTLADAFRQGHAGVTGVPLPALPLAWERLRNAVHLLVSHRRWTSPPRSWGTSLPLRYLVRQLHRELASHQFDSPD